MYTRKQNGDAVPLNIFASCFLAYRRQFLRIMSTITDQEIIVVYAKYKKSNIMKYLYNKI